MTRDTLRAQLLSFWETRNVKLAAPKLRALLDAYNPPSTLDGNGPAPRRRRPAKRPPRRAEG